MKTKFPKNRTINKESGAVMMTSVIFFVVISTIVVLGLTAPSAREYRIASDSVISKQSYFLAESGAEDAFYRLKNHYPTTSPETLVLGSSMTTTTLNSLAGGIVDIQSIGNVQNSNRAVDVHASGQSNPTFTFGALSGSGGLNLSQSNAVVDGNAYLDGPITGVYGSSITGSAVSASSPVLGINQQNGTGTPSYDISFGNADASQDIAQSFQINQNSPLNKISLYLKKVGSPADATLTVYRNNPSNGPDDIPIASATISASSVGADYSWVDAVFSQQQMLSTGETYWFVVTQNISSTDYYTIGATDGGYSYGVGKIGQVGEDWTDPVSATSEYFFEIYLGGVVGLIQGVSGNMSIGTTPSDSVQAHSVGNVNAAGSIYCTNDLGGTEESDGVTDNPCIAQTDPSYVGFPVSDSDISGWENDASAGAGTSGDWDISLAGASTTGPEKISGNVNVHGGVLTINGTLWITGNLNITSNGKIKLAPGYGSNSGVVIVDGQISFSGGWARGSGADGSYILFVSKSNSVDPASPAISAYNHGADTAIFYAPDGLASLSGSTDLSAVSAYEISLSSGSTISYNPNMSAITFLSAGATSVPYTISSWTESQ